MNNFQKSMLELVIETSTNLPADVRATITEASLGEAEGTRAAQALEVINQNIDQACTSQGAICQDTGMATFDIHCPVGLNQIEMERQIHEAVAEATRLGKLRPNSAVTPKRSAATNHAPGSRLNLVQATFARRL